ncbi:HIT domain-containing protein [Bradyrhizobium sp. 186]|uniref:HIT family protein n=1 Tax=Bradyrhizobium sp. 186 TaxID=2782654 RepID=UPI00211214DB|nr:HIT domain-containing protein [Bradyrhizobium sp. 186]
MAQDAEGEWNRPCTAPFGQCHYVAFLDIRPQSPGHTLVIPKSHVRWVWDVPDVGAYFEVVRMIARAMQKAFCPEIHARILGEEVPHAHIYPIVSLPAIAS